MNEHLATDTQTIHLKLLAALEQDDLRNKKGREAIHSLIIKSHSVRLISDTVKANNGSREQYVNGLLALVNHYDGGASVSIRTLATHAACECRARGAGRGMCERADAGRTARHP